MKTETLAIETLDGGHRVAVSLPVGAIIHVTHGPTETDSRMVDIQWLGKPLVMFAVDVWDRGEEIKGADAA